LVRWSVAATCQGRMFLVLVLQMPDGCTVPALSFTPDPVRYCADTSKNLNLIVPVCVPKVTLTPSLGTGYTNNQPLLD